MKRSEGSTGGAPSELVRWFLAVGCQNCVSQEVWLMVASDGVQRPVPPAGLLRCRAALEEQVRARGLRPVAAVEDMAREDVFESDEELDAFLAHVYAERHANLT